METENFYYLTALITSICCLMLTDSRYKLAFWFDVKRTAATIAITMFFFVLWDLLGIRYGVFFKGDSNYVLPIEVVPEFPIEELFFLFLLSYLTLLLYRGVSIWPRT